MLRIACCLFGLVFCFGGLMALAAWAARMAQWRGRR